MKIFLDALAREPAFSVGSQAFIIGTMEIINKYFKDIEFTMLSACPEFEKSYLSRESFKVKLVQRSRSQLNTIRDIQKIVRETDCTVSAWGDAYITNPTYKILQKTLFTKHRKKPLVLFPSSMGPFDGGIKKLISLIGLKRFDCIMARDTVTFNYFKQLGLHSFLVPDTAFALEPVDNAAVKKLMQRENVPEGACIVGLNISQLLNRLFKTRLKISYPEFIAKLVYYLNKNLNCYVVLIPHQIIPKAFQNINNNLELCDDDRTAIKEVMKEIKEDVRVVPLLEEYSCRELKGIIGKCEIFIGGRMHSVIGAVSMGVPAVLMQYSHKALGVMDVLDLKDFVWDIESSYDELLSKINYTWKNRAELRRQINTKMLEIKNDAWAAGKILEDVIGKYKV